MYVRALIVSVAMMGLAGCNSSGSRPSESSGVVGPSDIPDVARTVVPSGPIARATGRTKVIVNMNDNCDPGTFNAEIRPGACVGGGGLKYDTFITQLTRLGFVGPWHFAPQVVNAREGQTFLVVNHGGETHTFTEVEEFGGGIVPMLNQLAHVPDVAPECLALSPDKFIAPGQTFEEDVEADEAEKYQCCIHPWMRLSTHVSEHAH